MSELIGLLPAAGRATRLGPIPCSKEIMPLGFDMLPSANGTAWQPVTALETHLRALRLAGVMRAAVVISETKGDIMRYVGDGERYDVSVSYLYQRHLHGMPSALDLAGAWAGSATTLFAMPDTLVAPLDTHSWLLEQHNAANADVTLGLFPTTTPHKFGMVDLDAQGRAVGFSDKPPQTHLKLMWGLAAWSSRFTRFLTQFLAQCPVAGPECVLSEVFQAALEQGLCIRGVVLEQATYRDIGTPEDFQAAIYAVAQRQFRLTHRTNNS